MTRNPGREGPLRLFFIKNAVLFTIILANACGAGLIIVLGIFVMDEYFIENYLWLIEKIGTYVDPLLQLSICALIVLYELPVRKFLALSHKGRPIPDRLREKAGRRHLNEPFVMVLITLGGWSATTLVYTWFVLANSGTWDQMKPLAVNNLLIALITSCLVFFAIQAVSHRYLTPRLFPQGELHRIRGVLRISLRARLLSLYAAINLIPLLMLLLILYRLSISTQDPAQILEVLFDGARIFVPLVMILGLALAYLLSSNLKRALGGLTRVLGRVKEGRFEDRVRVISNDEIGYAGEVVNEMCRGLMERDLIKDAFGRYVAREIRDEVLSGRVPLDGEKKEVSVLFADLRDFTPLTEGHDPKLVVDIMNSYFKEMAEAVQNHGGLVLQFLGDEVYAVFGAPMSAPDHAARAFRAGLEMNQRLLVLNQTHQELGRPPLAHGIGINSGEVVAANIGSPDRLSYLLVGDTVNTAARLQALNKEYGSEMIISAATRSGLGREELALTSFRERPQVRVKGKTQALDIFTVGG